MTALCRGFGVTMQHPGAAQAAGKQPLGGYCGGRDIEQCRRMFGENLERVCATCPN